MVLQAEKVIMFLRAMDMRDRKDLGVLMENTTTDSGLVETWTEVKEIVARYNKRKQWLGEDERKGVEMPQRMESTSSRLGAHDRKNLGRRSPSIRQP
jgi:hypothetical protein